MTRRPRRFRSRHRNLSIRLALGATLATVALTIPMLSAQAETTRGSDVKVTFQGKLSPRSLPRYGEAPIRVAVGATIAPLVAGVTPPALHQISIEINRHGRFDTRGLPRCDYHQIQPSTTAKALQACRSSLVGRGSFSSNVLQAAAAPFPAEGALYAFNGIYKGKPAILAHIYGATPIPISYTIPFTLSSASGEYGTRLSAPMPSLSSEWGYITGLSLNLGRSFTYRGERRSYLSGSCPTPKGVGVAPFKFARATFSFGSERVSSVLSRTCHAR